MLAGRTWLTGGLEEDAGRECRDDRSLDRPAGSHAAAPCSLCLAPGTSGEASLETRGDLVAGVAAGCETWLPGRSARRSGCPRQSIERHRTAPLPSTAPTRCAARGSAPAPRYRRSRGSWPTARPASSNASSVELARAFRSLGRIPEERSLNSRSHQRRDCTGADMPPPGQGAKPIRPRTLSFGIRITGPPGTGALAGRRRTQKRAARARFVGFGGRVKPHRLERHGRPDAC